MLTTVGCRRCGTELSTLIIPLYDSPRTRALWQRFRGICKDCMSAEEYEILEIEGSAAKRDFYIGYYSKRSISGELYKCYKPDTNILDGELKNGDSRCK